MLTIEAVQQRAMKQASLDTILKPFSQKKLQRSTMIVKLFVAPRGSWDLPPDKELLAWIKGEDLAVCASGCLFFALKSRIENR